MVWCERTNGIEFTGSNVTRLEPKQPVVFSDLDGTLLDHGRRLSKRNHDTLMQLGAQGVARVIVTGRSRFSTTRVMDQDFPIDYLVTSSGAGIYDFRHDTLLFSDHLAPEQVQRAVQTLVNLDLDFMIQEQVPNNHHFSFHATNNHNPDFERRLKLYEGYGRALDPATRNFRESTQLLAICPPHGESAGAAVTARFTPRHDRYPNHVATRSRVHLVRDLSHYRIEVLRREVALRDAVFRSGFGDDGGE